MMEHGRFITFEGGEGVGKSMQAKSLADFLRAQGIDVVLTREPGGTPSAEMIRGMLLANDAKWHPQAEILLHFAARTQHVEEVIRPALDAGKWVISDRFYDSSMAYQGYGQQSDLGLIRFLIDKVDLDPDLTIILTASASTAAERLKARGAAADRYESLGREFHRRVNQGFMDILHGSRDRCVRVVAEEGIQQVHAAVILAVKRRLGLPARVKADAAG